MAWPQAAAARAAGWRRGLTELTRAVRLRTLLLADGSRNRKSRRAIAPKRTWCLAGFYLAKLGRAPATAGWAVADRRRAKPRRSGTPSCFSAHRGRPK